MKKDVAYQGNDEHGEAYQILKEDCAKQPTLRYCNVSKPVTISCDSRKSGLGAVLEQDGHPEAYALRVLTNDQKWIMWYVQSVYLWKDRPSWNWPQAFGEQFQEVT